jgi:hypothetical protein
LHRTYRRRRQALHRCCWSRSSWTRRRSRRTDRSGLPRYLAYRSRCWSRFLEATFLETTSKLVGAETTVAEINTRVCFKASACVKTTFLEDTSELAVWQVITRGSHVITDSSTITAHLLVAEAVAETIVGGWCRRLIGRSRSTTWSGTSSRSRGSRRTRRYELVTLQLEHVLLLVRKGMPGPVIGAGMPAKNWTLVVV